MDNNTHQWSVVEYDDETIQIVPKCWLSIDDDGNKSCYWPPFNFFPSNKHYISAVKKNMAAKAEWLRYGATILGTYDDFEKGMKKLKKAEDRNVPLTNDVEKNKVNRKLRHKRVYTSSDDSTREKSIIKKIKPMPNPPIDQKIKTQASSSRSDKSQFLDDDEARAPQSNDSSRDSIHISNSSVKKKSKLFIDESVGKIIKSKKIYDLSSTDEEDAYKLSQDKASEMQKHKEEILVNSCQKKKNQLNNSYYQPELIGFKDSPVNHSRNQFVNYQNNNCSEIMTNRDEKMSSVSSSQPDDIDDKGIEDIFKDFPLSEEIYLSNLEEKLKKDMVYKKKIFNAVCRIGGIKTDDVTKLILRKLFSDKLAALYNWTGAKGKKPLNSLFPSKIIIDAVIKNAKESKESEIITSIKNWMRHAEARYKNKLLKQKDDDDHVFIDGGCSQSLI